MGITSYSGKLGILLLSEADISELIKTKTGKEIPINEINPLQYLIQSTENDETFLLELQSIFFTFIKEEVLFLPKLNCVVVGDPTERRLITSENFRDFQDILRIQNKREIKEPPPADETPGQRKMRLLREKRDAVKRKQQKKNSEDTPLHEMLEIASVYGIDIKSCSLFAFYSLIYRHQLKEKWDNDIQMLCAGADSKKIKTKYWGESSKNE